MEGVKAGLVEALELNLRGGDLASGGVAELDVMKLEEAIRRAKASAWPWKLEEEVVKATIVLEKWQSLRRVEDAIASRSKRNIKLPSKKRRNSRPRKIRLICEERKLLWKNSKPKMRWKAVINV